MFTPHVQAVQTAMGSRMAYARLADTAAGEALGPDEVEFITAHDSFYLATVSETGWPYVQHRGGPPGFIKIIDDRTIGFADYRGNRQYISVGNLATEHRVSLFLMDYPQRRRLKLLGLARIVSQKDDPDLLAQLTDDYPALVERGIVITLGGYDWNCPQHITPRFSEHDVLELTGPLRVRLRALEAEVAELRAAQPRTGE
jgi:predicted pyridoxine 5'-phosphate oxidase superfamily flavin-nucleotide-binding protein